MISSKIWCVVFKHIIFGVSKYIHVHVGKPPLPLPFPYFFEITVFNQGQFNVLGLNLKCTCTELKQKNERYPETSIPPYITTCLFE